MEPKEPETLSSASRADVARHLRSIGLPIPVRKDSCPLSVLAALMAKPERRRGGIRLSPSLISSSQRLSHLLPFGFPFFQQLFQPELSLPQPYVPAALTRDCSATSSPRPDQLAPGPRCVFVCPFTVPTLTPWAQPRALRCASLTRKPIETSSREPSS